MAFVLWAYTSKITDNININARFTAGIFAFISADVNGRFPSRSGLRTVHRLLLIFFGDGTVFLFRGIIVYRGIFAKQLLGSLLGDL